MHKRTKRSTDNNVDNNQDQMSINETNSGQIINGTFTDTSNGAVIPTNQTVSEMNQAGKITGWHVKDNDQTEIPLMWGPKALPPYNPYVFDKTNNKIAAVLSKYPNNLGGVAGDKTVGPIYQDVDVTPGSEVQLYFIGTSMGNTHGINGVKVSIYDSNNPIDLLYSGRPNTASKSFGVFTGVFNVPNNVSRLRFMFETFEKRSYESANGGRILKGKNNFGGSGLADVKVNSGAYLKATTTQTKYTVTSPSTSTSSINATLEVSLENKGHSRSNKTQYKVVLPEGVQFISAQNARANYNSSNRLLTLNVDRIEPGTIKNITYTVSLPTSEPIKKDFDATLVYVTDGINMNRRNGSRDFGSNADDNYFRYGGYNEYVKTESNQRRGNVTVATQSVTVEMYKTDLQQKYNQISAQIEHLNPSDYSQEAWSSMQNVLNASRQILNENDNTPINDRKNQATINDLTLRLDKERAKLDVDQAAKSRKEVINNNNDATREEKDTALTLLKATFDEKVRDIESATNINEISERKNQAIVDISPIDVIPTIKQQAIQSLNDKADEKLIEIENDTNATFEEREQAKKSVNEALINAKNAVRNATTNQLVETVLTSNSNNISQISTHAIARDKARQELDRVIASKMSEIDNDHSATIEEKNESKAKIDEIAKQARLNIERGVHNDDVKVAKDKALNQLHNVQVDAIKKNQAKQTITDQANSKKAEIDQTPNATDEEKAAAKAAAKAKVDEAVTTAKNAIDQATNNDGVDTAKTNGVDAINNVQPTVVKKDEAKTAIDKAAEAKKAEIDQTPNATDEEKIAAKAKVDEAVNNAKASIDQVTNNECVDTAKSNGLDSINNIQPTVVKKDEAKTAIDKAAEAKKAEIDQTPNATDEEKAAAKAKIDEAVNNAKASIDQVTNNAGVDTAKTNGVDTINNIQPTVVKKDEAKTAIENAARAKKAEIDQTPNATDEEKVAAKAKVDEAVNNAKASIDQVTNNEGVDTAKSNGLDSINNIQPTVVKKDEAKTAIDKAAEAKKAEIDQTPNATDEEKAAAKAKVDEAVNNAKASIDQATNNNGVDTAKTNGVDAINNVQPTVVKKDEAKTAIDKAAEVKKAEIDQTPNATDEEKAVAKAKIDEAVNNAKASIDQATNNAGVDTAKTNGVDAVNNVQPTVVKKDEAKAAIDKAAEAKKAEIDQTPNATEEEKAAAKAKVNEVVTTAKNAIDQTTNNVGVDAAKESGVESINQVQPAVVKKDQAKAEIDNVAQAKKAEIDRNSNATEEEKVAAKAKVDEAATATKQAIDKAVNNSEVDNAIDVGKTAINNIEADNSAKSKAIKHLQELVKQQMTKIDSNHLATEEEKAKAKQMIKLLFEKAKIEIEKAKTSYEVTKIDAEYSKLITKTLPENKAKLNAKKKIEKIARQLKNKLNKMNGVSKEEKDRIKVIIEQIVKKSFKDIDLASRNNTINKIVNDVKIQFANIKINKQNNKKSLINNENASVIITTEQHKTNKAYHKVRNEKGRYQLPNTGINNDTSSPLISFTFVSGLFLILRSMRRRASK
uniref:SasC/FmtB family protein n=1 Tax=Staphylococcus haemolyticus TaxID=1283 RepID=UPI00374ED5E5